VRGERVHSERGQFAALDEIKGKMEWGGSFKRGKLNTAKGVQKGSLGGDRPVSPLLLDWVDRGLPTSSRRVSYHTKGNPTELTSPGKGGGYKRWRPAVGSFWQMEREEIRKRKREKGIIREREGR